MQKKDEQINFSDSSNKTKGKIIRFSLFVILILLILLIHSCIKFETVNNLVPTGNIDIFDIVIDKDCCKDKKCNCDCDNSNNSINNDSVSDYDKNSTYRNTITENNNKDISDNTKIKSKDENNSSYKDDEEEKIEDYDNQAIIGDKESPKYNNSNKLNIFSNPTYKFKNVIAPLSSNTYQFVVRNNNDFNIKYNLLISEDNVYNINMKFKLKLDGEYINDTEDNWVTFDELSLSDLVLASRGKNVYQLEWKWFESSDDTHIGEVGDYYSLNISFDGEEILE